MSSDTPGKHWLVRPKSIRWLWIGFIVLLALTVLSQLRYKLYATFGIDGWFGFAAGFGFITCVAMIVVSKGLALFLKRPDDYYDRD